MKISAPMMAAWVALLSSAGCSSTKTASTGAQTAPPPESATPSNQTGSLAPPSEPVVSTSKSAPGSATNAATVTARPPATKPQASAAEHSGNQSGEKSPPQTSAAASAPPVKKSSAPTLNLTDLEQRLRDTRAIGVFTKLSLKNQVDDLLGEFRSLYKGPDKHPPAELRQRYDLLLLKVLSLLQDSDPSLASAISSSREAIWGILSDPNKFAAI
jgi:hypothetical protein